jgi:hypothetical protein
MIASRGAASQPVAWKLKGVLLVLQFPFNEDHK